MAKKLDKPDVKLLRVCVADARQLLSDEKMMDMQSHVLSVAVALFRKRTTPVA